MQQTNHKTITGYDGLRYPLTVISIDLELGADVHKFQPAFTFKFLGTAVESQDDGEDREVPRTFVETFDSPVEGTECDWHISEGDVITDSRQALLFCFALQVILTIIGVLSSQSSNPVVMKSNMPGCARTAARISPEVTTWATQMPHGPPSPCLMTRLV